MGAAVGTGVAVGGAVGGAVGTGVAVGGAVVVTGGRVVVVTGGRVVGFAVGCVDGRDVGVPVGGFVPEEGCVCESLVVGAVPVSVDPEEGAGRVVRPVVGREVPETEGVTVRAVDVPDSEIVGIV